MVLEQLFNKLQLQGKYVVLMFPEGIALLRLNCAQIKWC